MYFPLEVNEQLANAMRAAVVFKVEVEKIIEITCIEEVVLHDSGKQYEEMSDNICAMICTIGSDIGSLISEIALNEVIKANLRNNLKNESHVSE